MVSHENISQANNFIDYFLLHRLFEQLHATNRKGKGKQNRNREKGNSLRYERRQAIVQRSERRLFLLQQKRKPDLYQQIRL
jgi:stalled ribosome alternative rescue factor ArfA